MKSLLFAALIACSLVASAAEKQTPVEAAVDIRDVELDTEEMTASRYITGGLLGIYPGFGVGHAVQGRYKPRGAIFTGAELAIFGAAVVVPVLVCGGAMQRPCQWGDRITGAAGIAFLAVKAWEAYDAWAVPEFEIHPITTAMELKPSKRIGIRLTMPLKDVDIGSARALVEQDIEGFQSSKLEVRYLIGDEQGVSFGLGVGNQKVGYSSTRTTALKQYRSETQYSLATVGYFVRPVFRPMLHLSATVGLGYGWFKFQDSAGALAEHTQNMLVGNIEGLASYRLKFATSEILLSAGLGFLKHYAGGFDYDGESFNASYGPISLLLGVGYEF